MPSRHRPGCRYQVPRERRDHGKEPHRQREKVHSRRGWKGKNPKQGILGTVRRAGLHGRKGELVVGSGREEKLES